MGWERTKPTLCSSRGCQESFTSEIDTQMYPGRPARFSLICDPRYSPRRQKKRLIFPPLQINKQQSSRAGRIPRGTVYLYDLDWDIDASELPEGRVRFFLGGIHMQLLVRNKNYSSVTGRPISVTFSCVAVDRVGVPRRSPRDEHWAMQLRTDPGSKLLPGGLACLALSLCLARSAEVDCWRLLGWYSGTRCRALRPTVFPGHRRACEGSILRVLRSHSQLSSSASWASTRSQWRDLPSGYHQRGEVSGAKRELACPS